MGKKWTAGLSVLYPTFCKFMRITDADDKNVGSITQVYTCILIGVIMQFYLNCRFYVPQNKDFGAYCF
jgi:hypothetical protein